MTRSRRAAAFALTGLAALAAFLLWPEPAPGPVGGWMAQAGVAPRWETIEGLRVRYVRRGQGHPVVLLHGFSSSIYTWKDLIPALARDHDVIALDLPAHGGSDVPLELPASLYPRVVQGLMDRLGLPRATLVGNSLGGAVATVVAVRHSERVDRLVLIDSAGYNFAPRDRPWILRFAGATWAGPLLERAPVRRRLVTAGLRQVFYDDTQVTPSKVDEYVVPLMRPGAVRALGALLSGTSDLGFPGVANGVRAPTLIVWGREDTWIPVAHAEKFVAAIAGSRVAVIDGCGHMPQEEKPEETARLVAGFLAGSSASH